MPDEQRPDSNPPQRRGGMPGDGAGRREEPGKTGVHPFSEADAAMPMRTGGEWGRSDHEEDSGPDTSPPEGGTEVAATRPDTPSDVVPSEIDEVTTEDHGSADRPADEGDARRTGG
jgi:hypothetical protein